MLGCHLSLQMDANGDLLLCFRGRTVPFRGELLFSLLSVALGRHLRAISKHCPGPQTAQTTPWSFEVTILTVLECPTVATSLEQSKKPSLMFASRTATCSFNLDPPSRLARAKVYKSMNINNI